MIYAPIVGGLWWLFVCVLLVEVKFIVTVLFSMLLSLCGVALTSRFFFRAFSFSVWHVCSGCPLLTTQLVHFCNAFWMGLEGAAEVHADAKMTL